MTDRRPVILAWLVWLVIAGCSAESGPPGSRPRTNAPGAERTWSEQVRDIRDGRSTQIRIEAQTVGPEAWNELRNGCGALRVLEVEQAGIGDADLHVLASLPGLTRLKLGAPITDAGVQRLAAAQNLEIVNLPEADMTDAGLAALATLPRLQLLRLRSRRVSDAGLVHIAGMKSLRFLHLIDVPVTDAGLQHLYGMTWLESFYLDGGRCSDEGLSALLKALPDLHFHKDQLHLPGDPRADAHQ